MSFVHFETALDGGDTTNDLVDTPEQIKVVHHRYERRNRGSSARQGYVGGQKYFRDLYVTEERWRTHDKIYAPIDDEKQEIRLIRLLPGQFHDEIECELMHTTTDHPATPYHALSYVWGDVPLPYPIKLNGHDFMVTRNLSNAMRQMRKTDEVLLMWMDALSINQSDLEERSKQVNRMRVIYEHAETVYLWLGVGDESSHLAFRLFHDLEKNLDSEEGFVKIIQDPERQPEFAVLLDLWGRDYWWRTWVVQEVISGRKVVLHCGADSIDWHTMIAIQDTLQRQIRGRLQGVFTNSPKLHMLPTYLPLRGPKALNLPFQASPDDLPDLFETILWHRAKQSSDPKDKIYGIVGLTNGRQNPLLRIDYTRSVRDIYTDVVRYVLETTGKLDIIVAMLRTDNAFDLPSWVPDWAGWRYDTGYATTLLPPKNANGEREVAPFVNYSASDTKNAIVSNIDPIAGTMSAKCIILDTVEKVYGLCKATFPNDIITTTHSLLTWYNDLTKTREDHLAQRQAFCRTMMFGMGRKKGQDGIVRGDMNLYRELFSAYVRLGRKLHPDIALSDKLNQLADSCQAPEIWAEDWARDATSFVSSRRLFTGERWGIGLGPEGMREGDKVVIILGCCLPVILRKEKDAHVVVDQAYFDEFMFGEAIEMVEKGDLKIEELLLR